ncbi:MAG: aminotransferase class I/II-fold pyridoxal phosphate-dependent enzyme [Gemmatimonadales bacterium]
MASFQSHATSGASHPAQWAAATAFSDRKVESDLHRMVEAFRRRRDLVVEFFRSELQGVEFVEPMGAFYFFFRVDGFFGDTTQNALEFCTQLMAEQGVALVPGDAFGDPRWVRLSYAAADKEITKALQRIASFVA